MPPLPKRLAYSSSASKVAINPPTSSRVTSSQWTRKASSLFVIIITYLYIKSIIQRVFARQGPQPAVFNLSAMELCVFFRQTEHTLSELEQNSHRTERLFITSP